MRDCAKLMTRLLLTGLAVMVVSGCVGAATGQALPASVISSGATLYVAKQPKDGRDLHLNIAAQLQGRGIEAISGELNDHPPEVDYVVTYVDRWVWDMRMYLADLRIEVRDASDNSMLGYGQSSQSSLKAMGKSHDDVISRALDQLLQP